MKTNRSAISEKELFDAAKLLIENVMGNVESLKALSADSIGEAYLRLIADGQDDDNAKLFGMALGLEKMEVPAEYMPKQ